MIIFQFIRQYWILIALSGAFLAGYHIKGLQYKAQENHALITQAKINDKAAEHFEKVRSDIEQAKENINQQSKVIYAEPHDCALTPNELRLLQQ
jgi:hypothetical protein